MEIATLIEIISPAMKMKKIAIIAIIVIIATMSTMAIIVKIIILFVNNDIDNHKP